MNPTTSVSATPTPTPTLVTEGAVAFAGTGRKASIVVFPRVVADGEWDTIIQLANPSALNVAARCFYINGAPVDPDTPADPTNPPLWTEVDFNLFLFAEQPTHWVVSTGRAFDPFDPICSSQNRDCDQAGFDPGEIPPQVSDFRGQLVCIETTVTGEPVSGNHLVGVATLKNQMSGDLVKYYGVGIPGLETNDNDLFLCLGGGGPGCPKGAEYAGCPTSWTLTHPAEGAEDPIAGVGSTLSTSITIVPCALNLETNVPATVDLDFLVTDELGRSLSATLAVECWQDVPFSEVLAAAGGELTGSRVLQTTITAAPGDGGFVPVAQVFRTDASGTRTVSTMTNLTPDPRSAAADVVVLHE